MKTVVLYYSFEGNTEYIATLLKDKLNADLVRVKPVKDLKNKGFSKYIWGGKQVYMNEKPKLIPFNVDINSYDRVFLGSPVWAWTLAPAIKTVCEDYLRNQSIHCFYTHEGGDKGIDEKAQVMINQHNHLESIQGFMNVLKTKDQMKSQVDDWLNTISKKES